MQKNNINNGTIVRKVFGGVNNAVSLLLLNNNSISCKAPYSLTIPKYASIHTCIYVCVAWPLAKGRSWPQQFIIVLVVVARNKQPLQHNDSAAMIRAANLVKITQPLGRRQFVFNGKNKKRFIILPFKCKRHKIRTDFLNEISQLVF